MKQIKLGKAKITTPMQSSMQTNIFEPQSMMSMQQKPTTTTPTVDMSRQVANVPGIDTSIGGIAGVNTPTISPTIQKPGFMQGVRTELQQPGKDRQRVEMNRAIGGFETQNMPVKEQVSYKSPNMIQQVKPQQGMQDTRIVKDQIRQELQNIPELQGIEISDELLDGFLSSEFGMKYAQPQQPQTLAGDLGINKLREFEAPVIGPLVRGVGSFLGGTLDAGERLSQGVGGILEKIGNLGVGEKDKIKQATNIPQDLLNIAEGGTTALFNVVAPQLSLGMNVVGEERTVGQPIMEGIGTVLQAGGELVNNIPGLSTFKDSLSEEDQQRFDAFVGSSLFSMLVGTKGKKELIKKRDLPAVKEFVKNNTNPVEIIRNFQENVIGLPKEIIKTGIPQKVVRSVKETISPTPNAKDIVGKIIQGDIKDIDPAIKTFQQVDTSKVKTYKDLQSTLQNKKTELYNAQSQYLEQFTDTYKPNQTNKTVTVGKNTVTTNYISDALDGLEELYTKNKDLESLAKIQDMKQTFKTDGLTKKQINEIAIEYGKNKSGFSTKTGEPLTSVTSQAYENTRSGIKETFRKLLPDDVSKKLDENYSNVANTQKLVDKMVKKVNSLEQKIQERGLIEKGARLLARGIDIATFGGIRGFLTSFLPSNIGNKVMNSLDLQENLSSNLKKINNLIKKLDEAPILQQKKILKDFIKQQALPSPSTVTPSNIGTPRNPIIGQKPIIPKKDIVELPAKPKDTVNVKKPIIKKINSIIDPKKYNRLEKLLENENTVIGKDMSEADFQDYYIEKFGRMAPKYDTFEKRVDAVEKEGGEFNINLTDRANKLFKGGENASKIENARSIYDRYKNTNPKDTVNIKKPIIEKTSSPTNIDEIFAQLEDPNISIPYLKKTIPLEEKKLADFKKDPKNYTPLMVIKQQKVIDRMKKELSDLTANQKVSPETPKPLIKKKKTVQSSTLSKKTDMDIKTLKDATEINDKPIKVYRGEGKGIGNTTYVKGQYFADSKDFAETFGNVTEGEIPAGSKIFDFSAVKNNPNQKLIPSKILIDPDATTQFLIDKGYTATKNLNTRGVEYVLLPVRESKAIKFAKEFKNYDEFKSSVYSNKEISPIMSEISRRINKNIPSSSPAYQDPAAYIRKEANK